MIPADFKLKGANEFQLEFKRRGDFVHFIRYREGERQHALTETFTPTFWGIEGLRKMGGFNASVIRKLKAWILTKEGDWKR